MSVVHISASKKRKQRLHMAQATDLKYFRVIDGNTISFVFQSINRAEHNYWHCALAEMTIGLETTLSLGRDSTPKNE